jgi:hypothetical protein
MDRRINILEELDEKQDRLIYDGDNKVIMFDGPIEHVLSAMDIYMRESVLEAFEYVVKNTTGHHIDEKGNVEFKFKGEWITTKQLFENFI